MFRRVAAFVVPLLLACCFAAAARAQVQVKPWFLVIVDTSGSMESNCTNGANDAPTCTNCFGGCASVADSCGWAHTRINDAKCALRNILNSTGDAEFALMQFSHPCRSGCDSRGGADNTTCDAALSVAVSTDNYAMLTWVDGTCQGSCSGGGMTQEIYAYGYTPIAQSLTRAKEYFTGAGSPTATDAYAGCRPVAVIILTDGNETCGGTPNTAATALRSSSVPTPSGSQTIDIKTYAVGFGLNPGNTNIEGLANAGGTDAPGAYKGFYAQDEETLSAALNQIITNSQLSERCDGVDNDCDNRIDEDSPKYCDMRGIRASNPLVPDPNDPSTQIDQALVDSRLGVCSGGVCPAVVGVPGDAACAAPEWSQSSTCSPANILCTSPGEVCDGLDDDCDGNVDEDAPPIGPENEVCGDYIDNDCDGNIDENCNGCIAQPEICNNTDDDCDTKVDEGLTQACGTDLGECTAGTETCAAGAWINCTAVGPTTESCNNKDDDCDGVIDGITQSCGVSDVGLCRLGVRTCTAGAYGACVGNVDPAQELCDGLDNDCDNDPNDDGQDDPRVGQSCGSSQGTCSPGITACNNGDIVCVGATTGSDEVCDGKDNDCDGSVDEGVAATDSRIGQPCVAPGGVVSYGPVMVQGNCRLGTTVCSSGQIACPGYVGPTPELCDNLDQDCDGDPINGVAMTDPRVGAQCGTSVGECDPGQIVCNAGTLECNAAPAGTETCNGKDDDCDGLTDENLPLNPGPCDTTGHGNQGLCKVGLEACIGGQIVCEGEVTPSPEICDGLDNDCNGMADDGNPGGGKACGSSIGECRPSTTVCDGGKLTCPGATLPTDELCDGKDNDCDGLTDEDNPEGGSSCDTDPDGNVIIGACRTSLDPTNTALPRDQACGECRFGVLVCSAGKLSCVGAVGASPELCDGLDNDCDSPCVIDNSDPQNPVRKCPDDPCNLPQSDPNYLDCDAKVDEDVDQTDPNVGVACVGGTGECKQGTEQCVDGALTCVGGQGAGTEICNNKDDDCDTLVDEGFALGSPCGSQVGACEQGTLVCDPKTGGTICQNEKPPSPERCDGIDNDCNGVIDDGNPDGGGVCGSNVGECKTGVERCIGGKLLCAGGQPASVEVCDCLDNDCDGKIDEQPADGENICPGDSQCAMCQCAQPCRSLAEFSVGCPAGKAGVTIDGQCLCVGDRCDDTQCAQQVIESGGEVLCAPDNKAVGTCVCKNNACVSRCDGVVCGSGLVCDVADGVCKERSCLLAQLACSDGQYCDITTQDCKTDPCADTQCADGQGCRDGTCFDSCAQVHCEAGQACHAGVCSADPCAAVSCPQQQVCDPSSGQCVAQGLCAGTGCKDGFVCDPVGGTCLPDPCLRTTCSKGEVCRDGECEPRCEAPLIDCDDVCVNPDNSREHCGAAGSCTGDEAGTACTGKQVCSNGACTDSCQAGLVNCNGGCVDPDTDQLHCGAYGSCEGVQAGLACPSGTLCRSGTCLKQSSGSSGGDSHTGGTHINTTGGGGCVCSVPRGGSGRGHKPAVGLLLLALGLVWRRRRRRTRGRPRTRGGLRATVVAALFAWLGSGCQVNTLCLDCVDGSDAGPGSTMIGSGFNNPDSAVTLPKDAGTVQPVADAGTQAKPDAGARKDAGSNCVDTEICNGLDDDCDGKVDEGADPQTLGIDTQSDPDNCGVCGHRCVLDHAFSKCVEGVCQIDACDPEYVNIDGKDETGCEYRCTKVADDDVVCDRRDDDCDQRVDEDVDFKTDHDNCGSCGNACDAPNASDAGYCQDGVCKLDSSKCAPGFVDVDGVYANGCEYQCTPRNGGVELCNNADDDCDRKIDEGVEQTDARLGVACGADQGECKPGVQTCGSGGVIVCQGGRGPVAELCNGKDDNCDGQIDESFPQRGLPCGVDTGECTRGNQQCVAGALVCMGGTGPSAELCDGKDNDCDGHVDETTQQDGPPQGVGEPCTTQAGGNVVLDPPAVVGACQLGIAQCQSGRLQCMGEIGPTPELCDGVDHDCDGDPLNGVGTTDPLIGTACGTDVGECSFGVYVCSGGTRVCDNSGGKLPTAEICNGKDDDCDGKYDETDPNTNVPPVGAGEPCRIDSIGGVHYGQTESVLGQCKLGTSVCSGGVIACPDYVGPTPELCDNLDHDCDGNPLNGVQSTDARLGQPCPGSNVGVCRSGTTYCNGGAIDCQGVVLPSAELCDGLDNNCDGSLADDGVDEPTLGQSCGMSGGQCKPGTRQCIGGTLQCAGQVAPQTEVCDSIASDPNNPIYDNDCDGKVDEDFQLSTNVNRCGACDNVCAFPHATAKCVGGNCEIASCDPGYYDDANTPGPDCDVGPCTIAGTEICNGKDDDCNGLVDDGLSVPAGSCNVIGACAGAVLECQGGSGWVCSKLPSTEKCDGLDDNCNGRVDEGFGVGQSCAAAGVGACATAGTLACNASGTGTVCVDGGGTVVSTGKPGKEICNGKDDDCDGTVDEPCPTADNNCVDDDWVPLGGGVEIYKYEASRPDATASTAGSKNTRACSAPDRLPWTNLTYAAARAACDGADPNGRLCTEAEWEQACMDDASGSCTWGMPGYPDCNTWIADQCNGVDYDAVPSIQPSGHSGARDGCYRGPTSDPSAQIFELSGNVKELVLERDTGAIPVRGGANNNTKDGLRCDFDFPVWPVNSTFTNVGFRCCRSATPLPQQCVTFEHTGLNVTDPTLATDALDVPLNGALTDINVVNFTGSHRTMSEIDWIELVGPDATTVRLTNQGYCGNNNNWSYEFDQEGGTNLPPQNGSPCGGGATYIPYESLAAFYGTPATGTWTIRVHDSTPSGNNNYSPRIHSWGLRVCVDPN